VERAQDLVRQEISRLLLMKAKDPRLAESTITRVRMTGDLKQATVYFSTYGDTEKREEAQRGFDKAVGFFRREVGRVLELKFVPELRFEFDKSMEYARHMDQVLSQLHAETAGEDNGKPDGNN
jgi:ribosome-binding factor A